MQTSTDVLQIWLGAEQIHWQEFLDAAWSRDVDHVTQPGEVLARCSNAACTKSGY